MAGDLQLKPHRPQSQPQPDQPQPQPETGAPESKGVILLFGRGNVVYDKGKYALFGFTSIQPHPVHQPEEWIQFVETLLRAFLLSKASQIVLAVERPQIPAILALIGRLRTHKKVRPARVQVGKDEKLEYFPD